MAPPRTIRVGLLVCDTLTEPLKAAQGDLDEIYSYYWRSTMPGNCNARVIIKIYNAYNLELPEEERLDEHDIFMVTGSPTAAYDDKIPWVRELLAFLKGLIQNHPKIKLCGICFGHQIVCRALGGECVPNGQLELGPTSVDLSDIGRSIFGVDRLSIQEIHGDHVPVESLSKQFASGELHLVGSTGVTGNQGVIKFRPLSGNGIRTPRDIHVLTLQGHPEFSESLITAIARESVDKMGVPTLLDYWGHKGGDYDDEPEDKDGTGRRWRKTDALSIVSQVLWKMLDVAPLAKASPEEDGIAVVPRKIATFGVVSKAGSEEKDLFSRFWKWSNGINFVSKLFRRILRVASWW